MENSVIRTNPFPVDNKKAKWNIKISAWRHLRPNQSISPIENQSWLLEGLMLKLKLQNFGHLMWRADSLEKTLMLRKIEGKRRRRWQRMRLLDDITDSMDINLSKLREIVKDRGAWCTVVHGVAKSWTWLGDWTTPNIISFLFITLKELIKKDQ